MKEIEIKRVYGERIFERGRGYFEEGRVSNMVKFKEALFSEVVGTDR